MATGRALRAGLHLCGRKALRRHVSPQHIEALEQCLLGDGILDASELERGVGDGEVEMLGHLALTQHSADLQTDRILAVQGFALTLHGGLDADQILLGRRSSSLRLRWRSPARSGLLHTILARDVGWCELGHIAIVEQRRLQRAAVFGKLSDRRRPQRGVQSSPAGFRSSSIQALVIMPRSRATA